MCTIGKAVEDRRKQPVNKKDGSWLYLRGHAVVCSRHMELAALVTSMNPAVTGNTDSFELTHVQKVAITFVHVLSFCKLASIATTVHSY